MALSMKHLFTLFITLLSCTTASLHAMDSTNVLSLQQLGLQTQLAQWEKELHNAQNATERTNISAHVKDFLKHALHLKNYLKKVSRKKLQSMKIMAKHG